jgi:hypothetical protein
MAQMVAGTRFPASYRASFRAARIAAAISSTRLRLSSTEWSVACSLFVRRPPLCGRCYNSLRSLRKRCLVSELPTAVSVATKSLKDGSLFLKRCLVLATVSIGVYVVIACCIYPDWWFGLLWGGQLNLGYVLGGLTYLRDQFFLLLIGIVVVAFAAVILGTIFKTHLFRLVDMHGGYIVVITAFVLTTTALIVYHTQASSHVTQASLDFDRVVLNSVEQQLILANIVPHVAAPVDFHFLDKDRVDVMYNQIEPELIENNRTVASTGSTKGKAGISAGPVTGEVEGGKGITSTSSFARAGFSVERKGLEVMNFIVEKRGPKYYTTISDAIERQKKIQGLLEMQSRRLNRSVDWTQIKPMAPVGAQPTSKEPVRQKPTPEELVQEKGYETELDNELKSLKGYVFIDGEFSRAIYGDTITLVEQFSTKPHRVFFRVNVPKAAAPDLQDKDEFRLRVFGDVLHPMDQQGYVDIKGIAIY